MRKLTALWRRGPLTLSLADDGIRLFEERARHMRLLASVPPAPDAGIEKMAAHVAALLAAHAAGHSAMGITVAHKWTRLFMVTPPQHPQRLQDCRAAADMRFQTLYGALPSEWEVAADWRAQRPFLACAMPKPLLQALRTLAAQHQLTLLCIVPAFVAHWNQWRRQFSGGAWFGTLHPDGLTLAVIGTNGIDAMRTLPAAEAELRDALWLPLQVRRTAQLLGVPEPALLQVSAVSPAGENELRWLRIDATRAETARPGARLAIDFAPRSIPRALRLANLGTRMVAALGLIMLTWGSLELINLHGLQRADESSIRQIRSKLTRTAQRSATQPASGITELQAAAVNRAIGQLNLPWRDLLDAIQAATPRHIALLTLDPDAGKQVIKGSAEASSGDAMIAYIEGLKRQEFFQDVVVTRHEVTTQDAQQPIRFHFEARWRGGQQ